MRSPIVLAVDTNNLDVAKKWVASTSESVGVYKLGLEFFLKFGAAGVRAIQAETSRDIFLDLKLHDIPNTVSSAIKQVIDLNPKFLTVHASGGAAMIKASVDAAPSIHITAVTILTSLNQSDLTDIGISTTPLDAAVRLAKISVVSGARAIVCSPLEIEAVRAVIAKEISIITPGIRPKSTSNGDDQKRVMDPKSAIKAGADYLVIGRPITGASDPKIAAAKVLEEIQS